MTGDFEKLALITRTAMEAAQGRMTKLLLQEDSLRTQLDALQSSRAQTIQDDTPARVIAADVKWQVWIDHRRAELNLELARQLVKKDAARAELKRAFGKDQTVQALLKKKRLARVLDQRRQLS